MWYAANHPVHSICHNLKAAHLQILSNALTKMMSYAEIVKEYGHKCAMEYKVTYPECESCVKTRHSAYKKENCCCVEMPHYVSEQCPKCVTIQNDICHLKSEIQRTAMNYGIDVAATLETKPDFAEDIENLIVRIKIMERLLIIQKIETEVKCEPDLNDDADNMSVVSFEYVPPEDALANDAIVEEADDELSMTDDSSEEDDEMAIVERDLNDDFACEENDIESNMREVNNLSYDSDTMSIDD